MSGADLAPHDQRPPHVIRRADEQNRRPAVLAQDLVHEHDVLVRVGRRAARARWRRPARPDRSPASRIDLGFAEAVDVAGRQHEVTSRSRPCRARRPASRRSCGAAAGLARFADAAGEHDDRVGRRRRRLTLCSGAATHHTRFVWNTSRYSAASAASATCATCVRASRYTRRSVSSQPLLRRRAPLDRRRRSAPSSPRCGSASCSRAPRRCAAPISAGGEPVSDRRIAAANASASAATSTIVAVLGVEPADLRQIGRDDRNAHRQVFVQLRRIDVRRVVGEPVRHDADVEPLDVPRHLGVRHAARAAGRSGSVRASRRRSAPDRRARSVTSGIRAATAAMQRPDRPTDAGRRRSRRSAASATARSAGGGSSLWRTRSNRSRLTPNGNRCTRSLSSAARCAQLLRRHEHEVGLPEQLLLRSRTIRLARRASSTARSSMQ